MKSSARKYFLISRKIDKVLFSFLFNIAHIFRCKVCACLLYYLFAIMFFLWRLRCRIHVIDSSDAKSMYRETQRSFLSSLFGRIKREREEKSFMLVLY